MPHNALLKLLFVVFGEKQRWGIKDLRLRTEQPEAYLKEVLPEIAEKITKGAVSIFYNLNPIAATLMHSNQDKGKWNLTSGYRDALNSPLEEGGSQSSNAAKGGLGDDEEDFGMEEIC